MRMRALGPALKSTLCRFAGDSSGASLIEYSILIGMIAATVILIIGAVSGFINVRWTNLNAAIT
ncbi:hypothetical protein [Limibacillus sp. MBR-115]|jgi:pilus assembly protein Flp/PilA|uniref:Flp family type IVb pilin n=1 Tax=Limibacillus sp. MBR-115 TaxID=3156465 RepID=UPI00339487E9